MTAQASSIQAYQSEDELLLLTDSETCWDMTPTICYRSMALFMQDLAAKRELDVWPMKSRPWQQYQEDVRSGRLTLVAELHNPNQPDETLSIRTTALEDFAMDAFLVIDTNPNAWAPLVSNALRRLDSR